MRLPVDSYRMGRFVYPFNIIGSDEQSFYKQNFFLLAKVPIKIHDKSQTVLAKEVYESLIKRYFKKFNLEYNKEENLTMEEYKRRSDKKRHLQYPVKQNDYEPIIRLLFKQNTDSSRLQHFNQYKFVRETFVEDTEEFDNEILNRVKNMKFFYTNVFTMTSLSEFQIVKK